jgi:hypothetical protein
VDRKEDAKEWFSYSHCSPEIVHFHLGRTHATTNLASFGQTLKVDGPILYEDGRLNVYDDKVIGEEIVRAGLANSMLENKPFVRW